jgi:hypothetical protein
MFLTCGEWTYLFATNMTNGKVLLDIAEIESGYIYVKPCEIELSISIILLELGILGCLAGLFSRTFL